MVRFTKILKRLNDNDVQFIVVGGVAASLLGSTLGTFDLDVCAPLDDENLTKMIRALRGLRPRWRFRPDKEFPFNSIKRFRGFKNLYLDTNWGALDVLGELTGVGAFDQLRDKTVVMSFGDFSCHVLDIETLIKAKTAAGRDKDKLGVEHLEEIRAKKRRDQESSD
jgi:hypothetical protein